MDGVGYCYAHLYLGMWSTQEAIANLILRWRNLLLPIYLPWLTYWLIGLGITSTIVRQIAPSPVDKGASKVAKITLILLTALIALFGWLIQQ